MKYHIEPDGTIPCTNCGSNITPLGNHIDPQGEPFLHIDTGLLECDMYPYQYRDEVACPEPRNDDGLEYDEQTGRAIT